MARASQSSPPVIAQPDYGQCAYCSNPSSSGGLCWTHRKRKQRNSACGMSASVRDYGMSPFQVLQEACFTFNECSSEDDKSFERARDYLRKAAFRYVEDCMALRKRDS